MDRSLPDVDEDDRFLRSSSRVGMGGGSGENDSSSDDLASFNFLDFLQGGGLGRGGSGENDSLSDECSWKMSLLSSLGAGCFAKNFLSLEEQRYDGQVTIVTYIH